MTEKNSKKTALRTVTLRPESREHILVFEVDGFVSPEDQKEFYTDPMHAAISEYGRFRAVMAYKPTFEGYSPRAAEDNLKTILKCGPFCERVAYVNPPEKKFLQMKLAEPMLKCEIRYFNTDQFDEALRWICA